MSFRYQGKTYNDFYMFEAGRVSEGKPEIPLTKKEGKIAEKDLQAQCEKWLRQHNYQRLVAGMLQSTVRGFYGHWFESQRNAFMPDLLIVDYPLRRLPLFVELKVRNKWQVGQKQAIALGLWKLAFTFDEFVNIVTEWEAK